MRYFGSGESLTQQFEVISLDSFPIIDDFDEFHSSVKDGDVDLSGFSIDGILNEFFDGCIEDGLPL